MVGVEPLAGVRFAAEVVEYSAGFTPEGEGAGEVDGVATSLLELEGLAFLDT